MSLAPEDIEYIKEHLGDWLAEANLGKPPAVYEIELRERMIRVEEELRHQRELMQQGFAWTEKRFEAMQENVAKGFEQMDKRFEQMDKRFEQVDKRFEQVDKRFEELTRRMDRFMFWSFGTIVGVGAFVATIVRFWT